MQYTSSFISLSIFWGVLEPVVLLVLCALNANQKTNLFLSTFKIKKDEFNIEYF